MWVMRTVQIVIEEDLLDQADRQARRQKLNRSQLIRGALREHLARLHARELEECDRRGYAQRPARKGEFDVWDTTW